MQIKLISDIHLDHCSSHQDFSFIGSGDVLILAGDILCAKHLKSKGFLNTLYRTFLSDCSKNFDHVIYVLGNHEYYNGHYNSVPNRIKEALPANINILENEVIKIDNWNFIGFTFWTDFRNGNPLDMIEAANRINDYHCIRIDSNYRKLRPSDTFNFNNYSKIFLKQKLEHLNDNVFVISHHTPSYRSVPDRFKSSALNSAYNNNLDEFIVEHKQIKYWAHGHTHLAQDYEIEQCRVLCNPGGHPREHTNFNPNFMCQLGY